jgi:hypothetical protein
MDCEETRQNLTAMIHGELTVSELMKMHAHLAECTECLSEEMVLTRTSRKLQMSHYASMPEDFDVRLQSRLDAAGSSQSSSSPTFRRMIYAIAAMIILVLGIEFFPYSIHLTTREDSVLTRRDKFVSVFKTQTPQSSIYPGLRARLGERLSGK